MASKRVLVIGDIHEPVCRKGYLQFNRDLAKKHEVDTIVFIGDLVDWHAISFHDQNPECPSAADEYTLAKKMVQRWHRAFNVKRYPNGVFVCIGNHDARPKRLAESVQIPAALLRDYNEQWGTNWKWLTSKIIDNVYYCHGHGKAGGINPAYNMAKAMGMSVVMGHCHSKGGCKWLVNPLRRWFGMDTGCGIDDKRHAFAYAKEAAYRSVLSSCVVIKGEPQHIMMQCGRGEEYHDSRFK